MSTATHPPRPSRSLRPAAAPPTESHRLVRERRFSPSEVHIPDILRELHATGTLCIDISQGGVGSVRFVEEQRLDVIRVASESASASASEL